MTGWGNEQNKQNIGALERTNMDLLAAGLSSGNFSSSCKNRKKFYLFFVVKIKEHTQYFNLFGTPSYT